MQGGSTSGSILTVSKEDNLVMSSEDSSCPDESELELGLGLSLSHRPVSKSLHPPSTAHYARILTAKDFPSMVSSSCSSASSLASSTSSSSSSSSSSSLTRAHVTAGTKRSADSVVVTNGPSQVVGWPPLGAYRMNSFNNHAKSPATDAFNSMVEKSKSNDPVATKSTDNGTDKNISAKGKGNLKSSWFVKVNMDGLPIGRKVDLSAHSSYESLAHALEKMFNEHMAAGACKSFILGAEGQSKLLGGSSKFVLTYEDKEGDWMLVGDVPWGMFLSSVRRLRIMRTSEANGLAPRLDEKNSRQKSEHI